MCTHDRDSGLTAAPEAEILHELWRLQCQLEAEQERARRLELELAEQRKRAA